jgi:hypothetical protein
MFGRTGMIAVPGGGRTPATVLWSCLARHPEATFADQLKAHRLAAGLTLEALGERAGIQRQRVSDYECGRRVLKWRALVKLVAVLGLGLVDVT